MTSCVGWRTSSARPPRSTSRPAAGRRARWVWQAIDDVRRVWEERLDEGDFEVVG
jgi:hypothetical protein